MKSGLRTEWRMMIHRESGRIVSCAPAIGFKAPARIVIIDPRGTHCFNEADCDVRDWASEVPRGFNPQTSFLFRFDADRIVEADQTVRHDAVVL